MTGKFRSRKNNSCLKWTLFRHAGRLTSFRSAFPLTSGHDGIFISARPSRKTFNECRAERGDNTVLTTYFARNEKKTSCVTSRVHGTSVPFRPFRDPKKKTACSSIRIKGRDELRCCSAIALGKILWITTWATNGRRKKKPTRSTVDVY